MSKYVFIKSDGEYIGCVPFDTMEQAKAHLTEFVKKVLPDTYKGDPLDFEDEEGLSWTSPTECHFCSLTTKVEDDCSVRIYEVAC